MNISLFCGVMFILLVVNIICICIVILCIKKENYKNLLSVGELPSNTGNFCNLYPEAPGCNPYFDFTVRDFCEENPDISFCKNLKIDICKNNPKLDICKDKKPQIDNVCKNYPYLDRCKTKIQKLCEQFPNLCKNLPDYVLKKPIKAKIDKNKIFSTVAINLSGGGYRSFFSHYGVLSALVKHSKIAKNNQRFNYNDLFKRVNFSGVVSGGAWLASMLFYDKTFNNALNNNRLITRQSVSDNIYDNYLIHSIRIRGNLNNIQFLKDVLDVPFFLDYVLQIYDTIFPSSLGMAIPWQDVIQKMILLNRLNKTKIKDLLPAFKNLTVSYGAGVLVSGNLDINTTTPHFSYVLNPNLKSSQFPNFEENMLKFPCVPGPYDETNIPNSQIKIYDSKGNNFNRLFWENNSNTPNQSAVFDNTSFDTCQWNQMGRPYCYYTPEGNYVCDIYPADFSMYRCQNVGMAECCRNNSEKYQTPFQLPIFFSSDRNQSPMIQKNIPIQYVAYNYQTEKEPTGEMSDLSYLQEVNSNSRRVTLHNPLGISISSLLNYDTSKEIVSKAASASSSFMGFLQSPCLLKNSFYGSGFSDQEMLINNIKTATSYAGGVPVLCLKAEEESKISRSICDSVNNTICTQSPGCNLLCSPNSDYDWHNTLKLFNEKTLLRLDDGGNTDHLGLIASIRSHQSKYGNIGEMNIICITSENSSMTNSDLNKLGDYQNNTKRLFRNFKFDENRPLIHDNNFESSLCELPVTINDIINQIANFSIIEESLTILGGVLVEAFVSILIPVLGPIVATALLPFTASLVYELVDLDTDYHRTTDNYGKKYMPCSDLFYLFNILDVEHNNTFRKSRFVFTNDNHIAANILHYKDVELLDNETIGIYKGTKLKNLYIIQGYLDKALYGTFPFVDGTPEAFIPYKDASGYVFEAVDKILTQQPEFRDMLSFL
jgi:hypothetical protein